MNPLEFFVPGIPRPGGSKTPYRNAKTGKMWVKDSSVHVKEWRASIVQAAADAMVGRQPFHVATRLDVTFYTPRPKGHYRKNGSVKPNAPTFPTTKPDATKLLRSTEDALTNAGVWLDDSAVCDQHARKRYTLSTPGASICIRELNPDEA